jgi:UDP-N-acetylglucosamine 1-carboxyvinyltransferase
MIDAIHIEPAGPLHGQIPVVGAKNAILVTMASTLLTGGVSIINNVPVSSDVLYMIKLLENFGAHITFDRERKQLVIDTTHITNCQVDPEIMRKMRASVLVMGPLLARFGCADIIFPGGCSIGARPVDFHLKAFKRMGVEIHVIDDLLQATTSGLQANRIVLEYPSVGATENILMAATLTPGTTAIVHAALEPEVLDLVAVLKKMGANITVTPPMTIEVTGVSALRPIEHEVLVDRLEAGALLLAAAISGGDIYIPNARAYDLDVFLMKLQEMGHHIEIGGGTAKIAHTTGINDSGARGSNVAEHNLPGIGVRLIATKNPQAVSFKTGPYPGFPTDLQAPMMVAQCLAAGVCEISETVFENRFLHVRELQKMGAQIKMLSTDKVQVRGVDALYGTHVIASDIRASCALVLAGFAAKGETIVTGVNHWRRGYDMLEQKLQMLGAKVTIGPVELVATTSVDRTTIASKIL